MNSSEPDTALPRSAGRAIARLARSMERALVTFELSVPQYRVLGVLTEGTAASSRLAARLAVSPASLTAVVDGLVARGLAERGADPTDRRRLPIVVTDHGRALFSEADAAVDALLFDIAGHFPDGDRSAALEMLRAWNEALDSFVQARDDPSR